MTVEDRGGQLRPSEDSDGQEGGGENRWGHVGTGKDRCCEYSSVLTLTWGSSCRAMRT